MRHVDFNLLVYYIIGISCIIIISFVTFHISARRNLKLPRWSIYGLIGASVYMIFAQLLKYYSLHFYTDFSQYAQVIHSISTIGKPICVASEVYRPGTLNFFSLHFSPLVYLISAVYKILPYNETIMGLNFLLMISSVIPLYKLAVSCHQDKRFALFIVVVLLWYPTFQYTVLYEFEMLKFSIPIILWMLYFWQKKNMTSYYLFALLAVLVREDVGLTIMMFGFYIFFFEKQRKKTGAITALIGMVAFIVILLFIMPSFMGPGFSENDTMKIYYSAFGETNVEVIKNIILNPILAISIMVHKIKVANVFMMFLPLLFIPFLAPAVLLGSLAQFGIVLLSSTLTNSSYMLHYVSPTIPFIFFAFIKGWTRLLKLLKYFANKKNRVNNLNSAAMTTVLSGILIANVFFGPSPMSLQFWSKELRPAPFRTQNFHYSVYKVTDHHRKAAEFCRMIPDTSIVAAHDFLQPRLSDKRGAIFLHEHSKNHRFLAEYVFFDKTNNHLNPISPAYKTQEVFQVFEKDKETWELIKSEDGFFLYRRKR